MLLKPIIFISLVLAGAFRASAEDIKVKVRDQYINFPVSQKDDRAVMTISAPGKEDYSFEIRLASGQPDYWVFLDMSGLSLIRKTGPDSRPSTRTARSPVPTVSTENTTGRSSTTPRNGDGTTTPTDWSTTKANITFSISTILSRKSGATCTGDMQ